PWMTGHVLRADIHFDPRDDSQVDQGHDERSSVLLLLTDRLIIQDGATDRFAEPWRAQDELPISTPALDRLRDPQASESLVARCIALIHREQTLVACDHTACPVDD